MTNAGQFAPGHPKKGGRRKGRRNKIGADVRDLAQVHTSDAVDTLARVMHDRKAPPAARVMAANALLDRGHGKPPQALTGPNGGPPIDINISIIRASIATKLDRLAGAEAAKADRLIEATCTEIDEEISA